MARGSTTSPTWTWTSRATSSSSFTGLSGSGKSSLAFDTIYAEGQRRYVESLSSYARQFLGQMDKPDLDSIDGLSPAVSIDQKTTVKNPRSTVGTTTEIYDYLRLLYARVGTPHCPDAAAASSRSRPPTRWPTRSWRTAPGDARHRHGARWCAAARASSPSSSKTCGKEGFSRVRVDGEMRELDDERSSSSKKLKHVIEVVVDRIVAEERRHSARIAEAVEHGHASSPQGSVLVRCSAEARRGRGRAGTRPEPRAAGARASTFSLALACPEHGHSMDELQPRDFSFNAPYGACPDCLGLGSRKRWTPTLVVPDGPVTLA